MLSANVHTSINLLKFLFSVSVAYFILAATSWIHIYIIIIRYFSFSNCHSSRLMNCMSLIIYMSEFTCCILRYYNCFYIFIHPSYPCQSRASRTDSAQNPLNSVGLRFLLPSPCPCHISRKGLQIFLTLELCMILIMACNQIASIQMSYALLFYASFSALIIHFACLVSIPICHVEHGITLDVCEWYTASNSTVCREISNATVTILSTLRFCLRIHLKYCPSTSHVGHRNVA